jgi:4'-phosphopantetheinyl transferase
MKKHIGRSQWQYLDQLMIICCYTEITHPWSEQELADKLVLLPEKLRKEALRKRQWLDMQLSIAGKLLLIQLLKNFGLDAKLLLPDLNYTAFHRPYFETDIDFNIAHSGNIAVCCGTLNGRIGIDIEYIKKIDLDDYTDYFTQNEWNNINQSPDKYDGFYYYWTRKEAVIKAIGTGFYMPLSSVDVSGKSLVYGNNTYYLQSLNISNDYKCHIATTMSPADVQLIRITL